MMISLSPWLSCKAYRPRGGRRIATAGLLAGCAASTGAAQAVDRCLAKDRLVRIHDAHGHLTAVIAPGHGGEMIGLAWSGPAGSHELLYRGMDLCSRPGWEGKAPVLWPATGRSFAEDPAALPPGTSPETAFGWSWRGQRLPMPIHGFARSRAWTVVASDPRAVTVELRDDGVSRASYPFGFRFRITYRLDGDRLTIRHRISAAPSNRDAMPFSLGNHITFAVTEAGRVSLPAGQRLPLDDFGRPSGPPVPMPAIIDRPLRAFGTERALSLAGPDPLAATATLDTGEGWSLAIRHVASRRPAGAPVQFNLWGNVDRGFFAVEPWIGKQNALLTGDGVVRLRPGATFGWTVMMAVRTATG